MNEFTPLSFWMVGKIVSKKDVIQISTRSSSPTLVTAKNKHVLSWLGYKEIKNFIL
jgi:hypothetical protein